MDRLEAELRSALGRKAAPPGFAARVSSGVGADARSPAVVRQGARARWAWVLAAAASVALATGLGVYQHRIRERDRNEAALHRTLAALSIAAAQLDRAEKKAFSPERWQRLRNGISASGHGDSAPVHSSEGPPRI